MNSYKKGEDTATVVVLLLLILAAVWLWKNNSASVPHEESATSKANASSVSIKMDRQSTAMNEQTHTIFTKESYLSK